MSASVVGRKSAFTGFLSHRPLSATQDDPGHLGKVLIGTSISSRSPRFDLTWPYYILLAACHLSETFGLGLNPCQQSSPINLPAAWPSPYYQPLTRPWLTPKINQNEVILNWESKKIICPMLQEARDLPLYYLVSGQQYSHACSFVFTCFSPSPDAYALCRALCPMVSVPRPNKTKASQENPLGRHSSMAELPFRIHLATCLQHAPVQLCQRPGGI